MTCCRVAILLLLSVACYACGDTEGPSDTSNADNIPPIARLDVPLQASVGDVIIIDGSRSSDPDGTIVTYLFSFGGDAPFLQTRSATLAHTLTEPGDLLVSLTVTDDSGTKATERTTIFVSP